MTGNRGRVNKPATHGHRVTRRRPNGVWRFLSGQSLGARLPCQQPTSDDPAGRLVGGFGGRVSATEYELNANFSSC